MGTGVCSQFLDRKFLFLMLTLRYITLHYAFFYTIAPQYLELYC